MKNSIRKSLASGVLICSAAWAHVALGQQLERSGRPSSNAMGHDLQVTVTDVEGKAGEIVIALFADADGFPDQVAKAATKARVKLDKPTYTFANLPAGEYAVVVFHDRNKNGKVDKSPFGFPTEPIGLSNHRSLGPNGGPPNFGKAKIDVAKTHNVEVNLIRLGR